MLLRRSSLTAGILLIVTSVLLVVAYQVDAQDNITRTEFKEHKDKQEKTVDGIRSELKSGAVDRAKLFAKIDNIEKSVDRLNSQVDKAIAILIGCVISSLLGGGGVVYGVMNRGSRRR